MRALSLSTVVSVMALLSQPGHGGGAHQRPVPSSSVEAAEHIGWVMRCHRHPEHLVRADSYPCFLSVSNRQL